MQRKIYYEFHTKNAVIVDYNYYWESSAEENIREFRGFWALANVLLLLFSINFFN